MKANAPEYYISKSAVVAEIDRRIASLESIGSENYLHDNYPKQFAMLVTLKSLKFSINTLEVIDPYEQCIQYASIEGGIKSQAEDYSFNIESELFNQLTKEQQVLWRKEIEQACISGGYSGYSLAKDPRYKENLEVKDVDLEKEIGEYLSTYWHKEKELHPFLGYMAKHFFELGLKAQKEELLWNYKK